MPGFEGVKPGASNLVHQPTLGFRRQDLVLLAHDVGLLDPAKRFVGRRHGSEKRLRRFTTWTLSIATRLAFDELRHKRWNDVSFEAVTADAKTPLVFESAAVMSQERMIARERVLGRLRQVLEKMN